jgi:hypothetical protein
MHASCVRVAMRRVSRPLNLCDLGSMLSERETRQEQQEIIQG